MIAKYAVFAVAVAVASPAFAVTVVSNLEGAPDPGLPTGYTTVIDFETGWPSAINTTMGEVVTAQDTQSGRASPAGNNTIYQSVGSNTQNATGMSFFDFSSLVPEYRPYLTGFSLYWGSIDTYNTLQFFNKDGGLVQSFTGSDFSDPANGNRTIGETNRRITFGFTQLENVTGVKFSSTSDAFEFDDLGITSSVPEPASWAMLIAGFGLIGATMRRRRPTMAHVTN